MNPRILLLPLCLVLGAVPAQAQESFAFGDDIFVGISAARVSTGYGRASFGLDIDGISYVLTRPDVGGFDDTTLALEISVPIRPWLSLDLLVTGIAEDSGFEQWVPDPPFPPSLPGDFPAPDVMNVTATSELRTFVVSGTLRRELFPRTIGYARIGAAAVQSKLILMENETLRAHLDETDVRPWLALGARYRFANGFIANAEFGAATEGHSMVRFGVGWTF